MTKVKSKLSLDDIGMLVQKIVDLFKPQKVILFGSHAYGQPTEDSDVDLLVVIETDENPLHTAARISASIEHPFPLEIIVRTPVELDAYLAEKSTFETEVMAKGVTLYEAKD